MQDRVPTPGQEGRVLITPENGSPAYHAKVEMADNPSQAGTPLNKATLLKDATAALFGLGTDAVPNDALLLIANNLYNGLGNQYVWEKSVYVESLTAVGKTQLFEASSSGYSVSVQWSDSINVDSSGGVTLNNPQTIVFNGIDENTKWNSLKGNYAVFNEEVFKFSEDATFSSTTGGGYDTKFVDSGGYTVGSALAHESYVNSADADAYPPAEPDGYVYTPLGQLGNKVQIETGSYVGTGTYGSSNPNSLTFGFEPKLVFISGGGTQSPITMLISESIQPLGVLSSGSGESVSVLSYVSATIGKETTWYSTGNENAQANKQGESYTYIAIG